MQQIKDVMTHDVQVISPEAPISEAAGLMRDGDFGLLPVGEDDRMIGTISDRDIVLRAVAEGKDGSTSVRDVMTGGGVHWVYEDDSVDKAAALMSEHQVRRLPVVNARGLLVGVVTMDDVLQTVAERLSAVSRVIDTSSPRRLAMGEDEPVVPTRGPNRATASLRTTDPGALRAASG